MSVATVKAHVSRLLQKLELDNRVQIALLAHDAGLAQPRSGTNFGWVGRRQGRPAGRLRGGFAAHIAVNPPLAGNPRTESRHWREMVVYRPELAKGPRATPTSPLPLPSRS